jgi:hypothetical protein
MVFFSKGNCALTIEANNFVLTLTNAGLAEYFLFRVWTKENIIIIPHKDGLQTAFT